MFKDELTTATTRGEEISLSIDAENRKKLASSRCNEIGDHSAFRTERHSVASIFNVTTGHDTAIIY